MPVDPELAAYLEAQSKLPPRSSLSLAQLRERMVDAAKANGGEPPEVDTRDFTLDAGVPVREYGGAASPLVVYFHGGRFISGGLESHDIVCRKLAAGTPCRVLAVDYRLAPGHPFPAAIEDALHAVDWALAQCEKVIVAGDSAGACLAAVAASERRTKIHAQILIYPMIDATCSLSTHQEYGEGFGPTSSDMRRGWELYLPPAADPRDPRISPYFGKDLGTMPPAFVATAQYDCLRGEGDQYAHDMGVAGTRVELRRYRGAIHGFLTMPGISELARNAFTDIESYIRRIVEPPQPKPVASVQE